MVCIYCGGRTQVTNSRPQKRLNHVWRRRECQSCQAVFTTEEAVDYGGGIVVHQSDGSIRPFNRDKLFMSVHKALGHRQTALEDASALTATIVAKLLQSGSTASRDPAEIVQITLETLQRFDTAASVQYAAYHKA